MIRIVKSEKQTSSTVNAATQTATQPDRIQMQRETSSEADLGPRKMWTANPSGEKKWAPLG